MIRSERDDSSTQEIIYFFFDNGHWLNSPLFIASHRYHCTHYSHWRSHSLLLYEGTVYSTVSPDYSNDYSDVNRWKKRRTGKKISYRRINHNRKRLRLMEYWLRIEQLSYEIQLESNWQSIESTVCSSLPLFSQSRQWNRKRGKDNKIGIESIG